MEQEGYICAQKILRSTYQSSPESLNENKKYSTEEENLNGIRTAR